MSRAARPVKGDGNVERARSPAQKVHELLRPEDSEFKREEEGLLSLQKGSHHEHDKISN